MSTCKGCGNPLPPTKPAGRPRKWCSEKCRKTTLYSRRCIECGAVCNTDGSVTDAAVRCGSCNGARQGAHQRAAAREKALRMLKLRQQGLTNRQIAVAVGRPPESVSRSLGRLRREGVDVPPTPHWLRGGNPKRKAA